MGKSRATRSVALALATTTAAVLVLAGCSDDRSGEGPLPLWDGDDLAALSQGAACDDLAATFQRLVLDPPGGGGWWGSSAGSGGRATEDSASAGEAMAAPAPSTSAAEAPGSWGGTNIQEAGVDEADIAKADGDRLLTLTDGRLRAYRLVGGLPEPAGTLDVSQPGAGQLLVDGDTALVALGSGPRDGWVDPTSWPGTRLYQPGARFTAVDVSDLDDLRVTGHLELDGGYVDARLVDGVARIVTAAQVPPLFRHGPGAPVPWGGTPSAPAREEAERRAEEAARDLEDQVRRLTADDWLPGYRLLDANGTEVRAGELGPCQEVRVVDEPTSASTLNVVTVDLRGDDLAPIGSATVVGAGELVYASPDSVYVTALRWGEGGGGGWAAAATDVHRFAVAPEPRGRVEHRATGRVAGQPLDQFSLSEHDGDLRLATTYRTGTTTESGVVVLREEGGELRAVGQVGGLGRGEEIRSVRFVGDVGYVVTFRQTDPLYTVDLRFPTEPRVAGELKVLGYSAYLHPVGEGLLLGVGQDATLDGRVTGAKVSLFDVSDPARPTEVDQVAWPGSTTEVEWDHHAFTWWADGGRAFLPVTAGGGWRGGPMPLEGPATVPSTTPAQPAPAPDLPPGATVPDLPAGPAQQQLVALAVAGGTVVESGALEHPAPTADCLPPAPCPRTIGPGEPVRRSMVVDGTLLTVSSAGVMASDPVTLAQRAWVPAR